MSESSPSNSVDALRISPRFTSVDWQALNSSNPGDWTKAADLVRDRLHGRFLRFANECLKSPDSGFVVLAIDSLMAETIQQFKDGITDGRRQSGKLVKRFLAGHRFQPDFDADAQTAFYEDIRCGLLHQAEAKRMWLIRRKQPRLLQRVSGDGYIVDVERFHAAVESSLDDYLHLLVEPSSSSLRSKLWAKMDQISNVRTARGAAYEAATPAQQYNSAHGLQRPTAAGAECDGETPR